MMFTQTVFYELHSLVRLPNTERYPKFHTKYFYYKTNNRLNTFNIPWSSRLWHCVMMVPTYQNVWYNTLETTV